MAAAEKLVILVTHGPDDAELATLPFVMAGGALASDVDVVMGFQGAGCLLVKKGVADGIAAPEFAPLGPLIATIQEFGGRLLACHPSVKNRGLAEADLLDGVEIVAAARLVAEITSATSTLVY